MNKNYLESILYEDSINNHDFDEGLTILLSGSIAPMMDSLGINLTGLPDIGSCMPKEYKSPYLHTEEATINKNDLSGYNSSNNLLIDHILESTKPLQVQSTGIKPLTSFESPLDNLSLIDHILESTKPLQVQSTGFKAASKPMHKSLISEEFSYLNNLDLDSTLGIKSLSSNIEPIKIDTSDLSKKYNFDTPMVNFPKPEPKLDTLSMLKNLDLSKKYNFDTPMVNFPKPEKSIKEILGFDPNEIDNKSLLPDIIPKIDFPKPELKVDMWNLPKINLPETEPLVKMDTSDILNKSTYKHTPTYTPPLVLDNEDPFNFPLKKKLIDDGLLERYKDISAGLNLSNDAVSSLKLTDPLKGRNVGPSFNPDDHVIKIPISPPKDFTFLHNKPEDSYRDIAINSLLPHEQGHAKVFDTFKSEDLTNKYLKGFNEHLADTFVNKADIIPKIRTELWKNENIFQSSLLNTDKDTNEPYLKTDYKNLLKKKNTFLLGHHTNIHELPNLSHLKEKQTTILSESLAELGYKPKPIIENMNILSESYKSASERLVDISKTFQDNLDKIQMKSESIISNIQKKTSNFWDNL